MGRLPQSTSSVKPHRYGNDHANDSVAGQQLIQYRSYQRDIYIYHVRQQLLPLLLIYKALQSQKEYRDRLTSFDPIRHYPSIEGDEILSGCIEAAYMPSILHGHGSALALRSDGVAGRVEWFIFSGPIHDTFLSQIRSFGQDSNLQPNLDPEDPQKIFNLVGYAEKGLKTRRVKGANPEHKGWYDSLCAAKEVRRTLRLTWKAYGNEVKTNQECRGLGKTTDKAEEERHADTVGPPQPAQKPLARCKA